MSEVITCTSLFLLYKYLLWYNKQIKVLAIYWEMGGKDEYRD